MKLLLGLLASLVPAVAAAESLNLQCTGTGTWPEVQRRSGFAFGSGGGSAWGGGNSWQTARDQQQFRVEVSEVGGRVKVPRVMVPQLNGGGTPDGWTLKDVEIGEDRITAQFSFNALNRPKVIIDRRSGEIDIKGSYAFSFNGTCEASAIDPEARKF